MPQHTLVVLQHGLWGSTNHMKFIQNSIEKSCSNPAMVSIFNMDANEGKYTYDGIDVCGERLVKRITDHVQELASKGTCVKRIIMVGYSLGGLILRYAIGVLGKMGFFAQIEPFLFVTFATPHLGVRREPNSLFSKTFNFLSRRVLARTGEQLQMVDDYEDGRPIMDIMTDPGMA
ncbi:putative serine esterase-domain-containing protein [Dichotomocladium elegans]|nr:putative serine esterase-domain-containing protein [Dichotomocladium elegans]